MIIHDCGQGSVEWLWKRAGIPTASEFHNLVTPKKLEVKRGQAMETYVNTKLAEKWAGPIMSFKGGVMEQGNILEERAIPWYKFNVAKVLRPGFITSGFLQGDEPASIQIGCSPDALHADEKVGVEFKCPQRPTHVGYLLGGSLPEDYLMQVQGSMLVTGYELWRFVSFCPKMPPLVLNIARDEAVLDALRAALEVFFDKFKTGWDRLCEINGGPPPPLVKPEPMVYADDIAAGRAEDPDDQGIIP